MKFKCVTNTYRLWMIVELLSKPDICLLLETGFMTPRKDQIFSAAENLGYNDNN
jgi:hypothetical protein